jgi:tetratricopeptide (TPR) repeat protein
MAERLEDVEIQIEALNTLSLIAGDANESVRILENVVELAESNELIYPITRAHNNIGFQLHSLGDLISARQHYLVAVDNARKMEHSSWVSGILANLTEVEVAMGNLRAVEDIFTEIQQLDSTSPESRAGFYQWQVNWFQLFAMGDWYPSLSIIRNTQAEARSSGDLQAICTSSERFAASVLELNRFEGYGEWTETESALSETIEISERGVWDGYESNCKLAMVFARQGRLSEAKQQIEQADQTRKRTEYAMDKVHKLQAEIELAFTTDRWQEAVYACEKLRDICNSMNALGIEARSLIDLADALRKRNEPGDRKRARETYQQSLKMLTEMGAPGYIKVLEERLGNM